SLITSSVPGNSYAIMSGTSMATPHVSAAFALLRQKYPDSSIDELLELLKSSDTSIIDVNGVRTSRIRLDSKLFAIKTIQAIEALVPAMPIYFYFIQFLLLLIIFYWLISCRIAR
ncbi:MAG: S8 family serine peptidase, partial [Pseudomonadota bacterium]